jgi:hypothetical protein
LAAALFLSPLPNSYSLQKSRPWKLDNKVNAPQKSLIEIAVIVRRQGQALPDGCQKQVKFRGSKTDQKHTLYLAQLSTSDK